MSTVVSLLHRGISSSQVGLSILSKSVSEILKCGFEKCGISVSIDGGQDEDIRGLTDWGEKIFLILKWREMKMTYLN